MYTKIYSLLLDLIVFLHRLAHILSIFMKWLFWKLPLHYYLTNKNALDNGNNNTIPYKMGKLPKHVTLMFLEDDVNVDDIILTIIFFMTAGISILSLTDEKGSFKSLQRILELEFFKSGYSVAHSNRPDRFYLTDSITKRVCEVIFPKFLFGRSAVVHVAKEISGMQTKDSSGDRPDVIINEAEVNCRMKELLHCEDPEMAVQFGGSNPICSLNPWLIRTTEFFSLPTHRMMTQSRVNEVLHRFARTEQRWGC